MEAAGVVSYTKNLHHMPYNYLILLIAPQWCLFASYNEFVHKVNQYSKLQDIAFKLYLKRIHSNLAATPLFVKKVCAKRQNLKASKYVIRR